MKMWFWLYVIMIQRVACNICREIWAKIHKWWWNHEQVIILLKTMLRMFIEQSLLFKMISLSPIQIISTEKSSFFNTLLEMVSHKHVYASFGHVIMIHIHLLIEWNGEVNTGFRLLSERTYVFWHFLGLCHWVKFYHLTISICYNNFPYRFASMIKWETGYKSIWKLLWNSVITTIYRVHKYIIFFWKFK